MPRDQQETSPEPSGSEPDTPQKSATTEGGLPPEEVEDRPMVGRVKPTDYPSDQRAKG